MVIFNDFLIYFIYAGRLIHMRSRIGFCTQGACFESTNNILCMLYSILYANYSYGAIIPFLAKEGSNCKAGFTCEPNIILW